MGRHTHYDWPTIQAYYDLGHSYIELTGKFGCAKTTIDRAKAKGLFTPRGKNDLRKVRLNKKGVQPTDCLTCGIRVKVAGSKYCGNSCHAKYHRTRYFKDWINGVESGSTASGELKRACRNYVLELAQYACSNCGNNAKNPYSGCYIAEVDHIDGDSGNNSFTNLRVLCPSCHALTEFYGSRNTGRGRQSRRTHYANYIAKKKSITE